MPVGEDLVEVERCLLQGPHVERLVEHEEAEAIREREQLGRRRIVARADRVSAHLPKDLELSLGSALIERGA